MGKAWQPPATNREFRFWISQHAVERFRERVEEEFRSRTDRDLAMLLDERIYQALLAKQQTDVIDSDYPDVDTKVVKIESRHGGTNFVVMRPYKASAYPPMRVVGGPQGLSQAAITVLTEEMATQNFTNGRWYVPNRPFANKLQLVKPTEPTPTPPPVAEVPKTTPAPKVKESRGGSTVERFEFAKRILRERPNITAQGSDGLAALVEREFGCGMSWVTIAKLREAVEAERGAVAPVVHAPVVAPPAPPPPAPAPVTPDVSIALQFAQAIEAEKTAKARRERARTELEAAQAVLDGATAQVEKLLQQMQSQRA